MKCDVCGSRWASYPVTRFGLAVFGFCHYNVSWRHSSCREAGNTINSCPKIYVSLLYKGGALTGTAGTAWGDAPPRTLNLRLGEDVKRYLTQVVWTCTQPAMSEYVRKESSSVHPLESGPLLHSSFHALLSYQIVFTTYHAVSAPASRFPNEEKQFLPKPAYVTPRHNYTLNLSAQSICVKSTERIQKHCCKHITGFHYISLPVSELVRLWTFIAVYEQRYPNLQTSCSRRSMPLSKGKVMAAP